MELIGFNKFGCFYGFWYMMPNCLPFIRVPVEVSKSVRSVFDVCRGSLQPGRHFRSPLQKSQERELWTKPVRRAPRCREPHTTHPALVDVGGYREGSREAGWHSSSWLGWLPWRLACALSWQGSAGDSQGSEWVMPLLFSGDLAV